MNNFKVGDKVVRLPRADNSLFAHVQGDKDYYVVTSISNGRNFVQLDGVAYRADTHPWDYKNFELYQEPGDDELPLAPESVRYYHRGYRGIWADTYLDVSHGHYAAGPRIRINDKDNRGITIDADAALQLAHDLRRMAMEIKRKEKANV